MSRFSGSNDAITHLIVSARLSRVLPDARSQSGNGALAPSTRRREHAKRRDPAAAHVGLLLHRHYGHWQADRVGLLLSRSDRGSAAHGREVIHVTYEGDNADLPTALDPGDRCRTGK